MFNIGTQELLLILLVVLLLFGSKRIPEAMRSFGRGVRQVQQTVQGLEREIRDEVTPVDLRRSGQTPALPTFPTSPTSPPPPTSPVIRATGTEPRRTPGPGEAASGPSIAAPEPPVD